MKKLLIFVLMLGSSLLFAQEKKEVGNWLAKRIYGIEVGTLAHEMKQDGVSEREYIAYIGIEGAILQYHEPDTKVEGHPFTREDGVFVLPFKVLISSDGRKYLSTSLLSIKSLNSIDELEFKSDVIYATDIDVMIYEYDDNIFMNNTKTQTLDLFRISGEFNLLKLLSKNSKPGKFIGLVGSAGAGMSIQETTLSNETIFIRDEKNNFSGASGYHYSIGAKYRNKIGKDTFISLEAKINHNNYDGYNFKEAEKNHIDRDTEYKPERGYRNQFYFAPLITIDGKLKGNTRYEFNIFGNIPLRDEYVSANGRSLNLSNTNARPIVGATLRLKL